MVQEGMLSSSGNKTIYIHSTCYIIIYYTIHTHLAVHKARMYNSNNIIYINRKYREVQQLCGRGIRPDAFKTRVSGYYQARQILTNITANRKRILLFPSIPPPNLTYLYIYIFKIVIHNDIMFRILMCVCVWVGGRCIVYTMLLLLLL